MEVFSANLLNASKAPAMVHGQRTGGPLPLQNILRAIVECPVAHPSKEALADFGVKSLWHITDIENVPGIMKVGLLSHRRAHAHQHPVDISDADVQRWRRRPEPCHGRSLHDYAVTYINVRNPMLYKRKEQQYRLCLLEIDPLVLETRQFVFTDRNAAARQARFFNRLNDLDQLPWDVLRARSWCEYPNGRQKRCAEVLVPDVIPARFIRHIWAFDPPAVKWLADQGCSASENAAHYFCMQGEKAWH